jgi:hypothetical protein
MLGRLPPKRFSFGELRKTYLPVPVFSFRWFSDGAMSRVCLPLAITRLFRVEH